MEIKRIEGEIEAILFAMGEAVELPVLPERSVKDPTTTENIIRNMMIRLQEEERGDPDHRARKLLSALYKKRIL